MSETRKNADEHPALGELEAARTGEASQETLDHIKTCEHCRKLLAELQSLSANLRESLAPVSIEIPEEVDQAVLSTISRTSSKIRRGSRKVVFFRWIPSAAVAAAVLLAFGLWRTRNQEVGTVPERQAAPALARVERAKKVRAEAGSEAALPAVALADKSKRPAGGRKEGALGRVRMAAESRISTDIDGSGVVDIVDAYLMARRLLSGEDVPVSWDFNGDGEVGELDVNVVASSAVALARGNR